MEDLKVMLHTVSCVPETLWGWIAAGEIDAGVSGSGGVFVH